MDKHEVYPNAPVALVVLELRHPAAEPLSRGEVGALKRELASHVPIVRWSEIQTLELVAPVSIERGRTERFPKLTNRSSTLSVSFRETAIVVETTMYPGWDEFRGVARAAVEGRLRVAPVDGIERAGLRYVDEIRVPTSDDGAPEWAEWVAGSVLGPLPDHNVGLSLTQWQGICVYGNQPGHGMLMRYGPQDGVAVNSTPELKRPDTIAGGPFFLVDIDSFWTPESGIPEMLVDDVMATCDTLHRPVRSLFEGLIKERLREEVFRR